jgi:hypothetical protein
VGHRHGWENVITMDLKEVQCEGVDLIHLAQDRVNTVINIRFHMEQGIF